MIAIDCRVVGTNTGVDYYTRDLVSALSKAEGALPLLLLIANAEQQKVLPKEVTYKTLPSKRVLFDHFRFRNFVADPTIKAVIHPDNTAFLFDHPNSIVVLHDVLPWRRAEDVLSRDLLLHSRQRAYLALQQLALKKVKKIITVSEASRSEIKKLLGESVESVMAVIPESVDSIFQSPPEQSKAELLKGLGVDRYAFYIGGFERNKNVINVLNAYEASEYPGHLILAGDLDAYAEAAEIRHLLNSLSRKKSIYFVGKISQQLLNSYYHHADYLVYLVSTGGFGRPILEAMKAGCPVICSNAPSSREVGGDAAWFVDPKNVPEVANAMAKLAVLPLNQRDALLVKISDQAAKFDWAEIANRFWSQIKATI